MLITAIASLAGHTLQAHASTHASNPHNQTDAPKNRLANEASAYLRQHGQNPVNWYPWAEEALMTARTQDKPIFLSIGYASCHWCHVMEAEVFSQPDVAAILNTHFISIKVDREERPDLDETYMAAVQSMTGRGGWPMSVFLTPGLSPFFGGTYFPKDKFTRILHTLRNRFAHQRNEVELDGAQTYRKIQQAIGGLEPTDTPPSILPKKTLHRMAQNIAERIDPIHGGWPSRQKFPTPSRWLFLLHARHSITQDAQQALRNQIEDGLKTTLHQMAAGGLQDHLEGGFHRYTVDATWTVPHFEKMLYDNAQLARLYLEVGATLKQPQFLATARQALDFLDRTMRRPGTAFFASLDADSLDADSLGSEGAYYAWDLSQIRAACGAKAAKTAAQYWGILQPNQKIHGQHGKAVLTQRQQPQAAHTPQKKLLETCKASMRSQRKKRSPPFLDRKAVTAWNGLAITAMAWGARVLDELRWLDVATEVGEILWQTHRAQDGAWLRARNPRQNAHASPTGVLDDYAFVAQAFVALAETSGDPRWLDRAIDVVDQALQRFAGHPVWTFAPSKEEGALGPRWILHDSVRPSAVGILAQVLVRLSALTGHERFFKQAMTTLAALRSQAQKQSMPSVWDAMLLAQGPLHQIVIIEPSSTKNSSLRAQFKAEWRKLAAPFAMLVPQIQNPHTKANPGPAWGKTARNGLTTAYVCERGICQAPTHDPNILAQQIRRDWLLP